METKCASCGALFEQEEQPLSNCPSCHVEIANSGQDETPSDHPKASNMEAEERPPVVPPANSNPGATSWRRDLPEFWLWLVSLIVYSFNGLWNAVYESLKDNNPVIFFRVAFSDREFLMATAILISLFAFRLVFGGFPLAIFGKNLFFKVTSTLIQPNTQHGATAVPTPQAVPDTPASNLAKNARRSKNLSMRIFFRSGVYLLLGATIAFSGVIFVGNSFGSDEKSSSARKIGSEGGAEMQEGDLSRIVKILPRAGILVFVEIIAFFFLKQYRVSMDEFRYYEAIARQREEVLALYRALGSEQASVIVDLVKAGHFFSRAGVLEQGQVSELLETRKLEKGDFEVLDKVIELFNAAKKQQS